MLFRSRSAPGCPPASLSSSAGWPEDLGKPSISVSPPVKQTKMRALLRAQGSGCSQRSSEAWAETTISARLQPELGAQERTGSVPSPSMPSRPAPPGTWRSCLWADVGRQLGSLPGMDREQHLPQAPRGPRGFRPSTLGLRLGGHRGHSTHTHVPPPTGSTLPPAHGSGGRGQGL